MLGGKVFVEGYGCAERRADLKIGHYRSEAGFGERDGEAAVGNIVGGLDGAFRCERDETIDEAPFGGEVDGRGFASNDGGDGFGVFARRKFA